MKALSLKQPWAEAILFLGKDIENRVWSTHHRGPLVIHCSKGWDKAGDEFLRTHFKDYNRDRAREMRGGFYGMMWVTGVYGFNSTFKNFAHPALKNNIWAFGPWCWTLGNGTDQPKAIVLKTPIKGDGRLKFFDAPAVYAGTSII